MREKFAIVLCFIFQNSIRLGLAWLMVFNATFNNISVISWWSVFIGGGN
jgi:hypothetical protein